MWSLVHAVRRLHEFLLEHFVLTVGKLGGCDSRLIRLYVWSIQVYNCHVLWHLDYLVTYGLV